MLTHAGVIERYAEQAGRDTACMLSRSVQIVATQLELANEVAPAERQRANQRAQEIAAKRYPELVAAVLDAYVRIYTARLLATSKQGDTDGG